MSPGEFYDNHVLDVGTQRLADLFPAFAWVRRGRVLQATNDAETRQRLGVRASRVCTYDTWQVGAPVGVVIQGEPGTAGRTKVVRWIALWAGCEPQGPAFARAVLEMANALGVDTSPLDQRPENDQQRRERLARLEQAALQRRQREAHELVLAAQDRQRRVDGARACWLACLGPVAVNDRHSPAWQYLQGRCGLWPHSPLAAAQAPPAEDAAVYPPLPPSIRCIPAGASVEFAYPGDGGDVATKRWTGPALVAHIQDHSAGTLGVQIIPLELHGTGQGQRFQKRQMPPGIPAKPMYGVKRDDDGRAGYVWIPHRAADDRLGDISAGRSVAGVPLVLCEGLETGWAVHLATAWPVMVCLDAGGLAAADVGPYVPPVGRAASVVIAGDHDEPGNDGLGTGLRAALACAERLIAAHPALDVRVAIPDDHRWTIRPPALAGTAAQDGGGT